MLATLVEEPFHKAGWVYEEKYDGYRILAYKEGARVTLLSRNQKDRTGTFSAVAEAIAALPARFPRLPAPRAQIRCAETATVQANPHPLAEGKGWGQGEESIRI